MPRGIYDRTKVKKATTRSEAMKATWAKRRALAQPGPDHAIGGIEALVDRLNNLSLGDVRKMTSSQRQRMLDLILQVSSFTTVFSNGTTEEKEV